MPIPYRPVPRAVSSGSVAYLLVYRLDNKFYGGILVTDPLGQPLEFTHATLDVPVGFLWHEDEVRRVATQRIAQGLFDACQKSPMLLLGSDSLGSHAFCKDSLGVAIPFVLISVGSAEGEVHVNPVSEPPTGPAAMLLDELKRRKLILEPFQRVQKALEEVYSLAPTLEG